MRRCSRSVTGESSPASRLMWNASARGPNDVPFPWAPSNLGCQGGPEIRDHPRARAVGDGGRQIPCHGARGEKHRQRQVDEDHSPCLHRATLRLAPSARKGRAAAAQSFDGTRVESHTPRQVIRRSPRRDFPRPSPTNRPRDAGSRRSHPTRQSPASSPPALTTAGTAATAEVEQCGTRAPRRASR
jgi:hypothetical protein